jgi:general secretion pathway protein E
MTQENNWPSHIRNYPDVPKAGAILSAEEAEKFGIGLREKDKVALFVKGKNEENKSILWIMSTDDFKGSLAYHGILKKVESSRAFHIEHTAIIEAPLLKALYENQGPDGTEVAGDNELIVHFEKMVGIAIREKVSDIHIEKRPRGSKVRMRKHGQLLDHEGLAASYATKLCSVIYNVLAENKDLQFSEEDYQAAAVNRTISGEEVKLRYQSLPVYPDGFDVVLRVLPIGTDEEDFVSLQELGYSDSQVRQLLEIVSRPVGALIIAGTTGSGKSTTLKNLLMFVNAARGYKSKIYTIEDPPEYKIPRVSQIPVVRRKKDEEKYKDKSPFQDPLTATMRGDPDVLMIGEVRDHFTADGLKKATQSGHQVMSTVHAASGLGIVERLADFDISPSVMGSPEFLTGLIYQKLVPILCPVCAESFKDVIASATVSARDLELAQRLSKVADIDTDNIRVRGRNSKDCTNCKGMGIVGRTVCAEVIAPDFQLLRYFREQDQVGAYKYWRGLASADKESSDMTGRTAAEHAIWKMRNGMVCPHDVEELFGQVDMGKRMLEQSRRDEEAQNRRRGRAAPEMDAGHGGEEEDGWRPLSA